jgi:hypothetical protein
VAVEEAGSTAPILSREVAYLYQRVLGREPDTDAVTHAANVGFARLAAEVTAGKSLKVLYNLLLERDPEPSELAVTRWDDNIAAVVANPEFLSRFR